MNSVAAPPAAGERLHRILEHELRTGCRNKAVTSGLDALLASFAAKPGGEAAERIAAELPAGGYASMGLAARERWIGAVLNGAEQGSAPPSWPQPEPTRRASGAPTPPTPPRRTAGPGGAAAPAGDGPYSICPIHGQPRRQCCPSRAKPPSPEPTPVPPASRMPGPSPPLQPLPATRRKIAARARAARSPEPPAQDGAAPEPPAGERGAPLRLGAADPGATPVTAVWSFRRGKGQPPGERPKAVQGLDKLGIATVGDLLRHYPFRHVDWTTIVPIRDIEDGMQCAVRGVVRSAGSMGRRNTRAVIVDADGFEMEAVWFNHAWLYTRLRRGTTVTLAGTVKAWRGNLGMANPEIDIDGAKQSERRTGRLLPVYSSNRDMPEKRLSGMIADALDRFAGAVPDPLPEAVRDRRGLLPVERALRGIHFPESYPHRTTASRSIAFADMLAVQIGVLRRRAARTASAAAPRIAGEAASRAAQPRSDKAGAASPSPASPPTSCSTIE